MWGDREEIKPMKQSENGQQKEQNIKKIKFSSCLLLGLIDYL